MGVRGDAGPFHPGQHVDQRQLDLAQQPLRLVAVAGELGVDRVGQVESGPRAQHQVALGLLAVAHPVEGELAVVGRLHPQFALQVAQREVGQVVGALVGPGEVGGERGVGGDAVQRPAALAEREQGRLGVVQHLGPIVRGQPGADRRLVGLVQRRRVEPRRRTGGGRDRDPGQVAGAPAEGAGHRHPHRGTRRSVLGQPPRHSSGAEDRAGQVEPGLRLRLDRFQVLVEPLAQDAELQRVEHPVHRLAVPAVPQRRVHRQR